MNVRLVWTVVKKEFLDNLRNRWIVAVTGIYLVLAIIMSYVGGTISGEPLGFRGFEETSLGIIGVAELLVPILGIMLGYAALAGEQEQGSLALVLSTPVSRAEVLLGKFLGLSAVSWTSVLVGLGAAGTVIAVFAGTAGADSYGFLVLGTLLEGCAFVAIALALSSFTAKRSIALGGGVLLWFLFVWIYPLILSGLYVATGGQISFGAGVVYEFPGWWWVGGLASPVLAYELFALVPTGHFAYGGLGSLAIPGFVNVGTAGVSLAVWILVPLLIAHLRLERRDV